MNEYQILYEWCLEEVEYEMIDGELVDDIVDQHFSDYAAEFLPTVLTNTKRFQMCLVRDVGNDVEGIVDRAWAYCVEVNGRMELPETFDNGKAVPKKFRKELERAHL